MNTSALRYIYPRKTLKGILKPQLISISFWGIDWFPNKKINSQGDLSFKIGNKGQNLKVYIEGLTEDGSFISEIKTLTID